MGLERQVAPGFRAPEGDRQRRVEEKAARRARARRVRMGDQDWGPGLVEQLGQPGMWGGGAGYSDAMKQGNMLRYLSTMQSLPFQRQTAAAGPSLYADASKYGSALDYKAKTEALPWQLAATQQTSLPPAMAQMGAAGAGMAGNVGAAYNQGMGQMGAASYSPVTALAGALPGAVGQQSTAHLDPFAAMFGARESANAQQAMVQAQNEAKAANLYAMLQFLGPMMAQSGRTPQGFGIGTDYGAGVQPA